jgi:hypothetical protein
MKIVRWRAAFAGVGNAVSVGPELARGLEPARVPAPTAAVAESPSPAEMALRLEVQQLRLVKTPDGNAELARRLRASEAARATLDERLASLQLANESLSAELRDLRAGSVVPS